MKKILFILIILSPFKIIAQNKNESIIKFENATNNRDKAIIYSELPAYYRLKYAYPEFVLECNKDSILFKDSTLLLFDDGKLKSNFEHLLNNADIEDHFVYEYKIGKLSETPSVNYDPGRIRNDSFFRKMYGNSAREVYQNLDTIYWLPNSLNKILLVTKINDVAKKLQLISNELDTLKHLHKYLNNPGGTFNWRLISGTKRLSTHSFGIAIDINVNYSNYWKWSKPDSKGIYIYKNRIPYEIVEIFEKHGFIWGGKWYHYDTMHFEYRPELCLDIGN